MRSLPLARFWANPSFPARIKTILGKRSDPFLKRQSGYRYNALYLQGNDRFDKEARILHKA